MAIIYNPTTFIYVLRSRSLIAREKNVETIHKVFKDYRVIDVIANDPSEITADIIKSMVDISDAGVPESFKSLLKPMHVNAFSNTLKHFTALRMVVENCKTEPRSRHVILEDDVLFNDQVVLMLNETIKSMPPSADVVFLGLPCTKSGTPTNVVFEESRSIFKQLPCCDSYIVTHEGATKLLGSFLPIKFQTPIHLSYLFDKLDMKVYACSPNVFIDGSKLGVFMSSIEQNNVLLWNPEYNIVKALMAKGPESVGEIEALISQAHFKEHPDFRYLSALTYMTQGKFKEARDSFEKAFDVYVAENCIVGPDSQFMKDYVQIFKYLQESI
jgi:hypothetical protein